MPPRYQAKPRSITKKFSDTFAAIPTAIKRQDSFYIHFGVTALVIVAGIFFQVSRLEWSVLVLCIFAVLSAEMFNRALEILAPAITKNQSREVELGLNVASAAVLMMAVGSTIIGLIIFVPHAFEWLRDITNSA